MGYYWEKETTKNGSAAKKTLLLIRETDRCFSFFQWSPRHQWQRHGQGSHALSAHEELVVVLLPAPPEVDPDGGGDAKHQGED